MSAKKKQAPTLFADTCRSCGADIIWSVVARSGRRIPLDFEVVPFAATHVAHNPSTGKCRVLTNDDRKDIAVWLAAGVAIHRAHFATCKQSAQWRVTPEAEPA